MTAAVTATNAPANEFLTREILESMNPQALRKLARERFAMTMPFAFQKPEIVNAILDQLSPDDDSPETLANAAPEVLANEQPAPVEAPPAVEQPTPVVSAESVPRDDVAAKLAAHRARLASEQSERDIAAAAKQSKKSWEPTADELNKRVGKLAYSIGMLIHSQHRIQKEARVISAVLEAMGELADDSVLAAAKQSMIEQYAHVQDRACFPSAAIASTKQGDELREAVWQEIINAGVAVQIAQLLGDQESPAELDDDDSNDDTDD